VSLNIVRLFLYRLTTKFKKSGILFFVFYMNDVYKDNTLFCFFSYASYYNN